LGDNPVNWNWSETFSYEIKDVYVAAPIHPTPYEPVTEYNGIHNTFDASLEFYSPGVYTAKIDFLDDLVQDHIQFLYVYSYLGKKDKGPERHSRQRKVVLPVTPDVKIIETPDSDNGAIGIAADIINGEVRAGSVADAIQRVNDAYANNGNQPVDVVLVGHGASGVISVGAGTGADPAKELEDNSQAVQDFIAALKGKVTSLTLKGCSVAGGVDAPGRDHLMERLADGLGVPVYAWDQEIAYTAPRTLLGITLREGYQSIDVHGSLHRADPIPEPSTLLLLGTGLACLVCFRRKNLFKKV
jgi:hypothetical protein